MSDPTPATMAAQCRDALAAGRQAAEARQPSTSCPYRGDAASARERVLAGVWRLGYGGGNPIPAEL